MNYLILLVSINLWSFNTLPNDVDNTSLFTASTEIAVTVYTTSVAEIETAAALNTPIPCWSMAKRNFNYSYVDCSTCTSRDGWRPEGPVGDCIPSPGGGGTTPVIGG